MLSAHCLTGGRHFFFCGKETIMPKSKLQGILLSLIMSLLMIYVMGAINLSVRSGTVSGEHWMTALKRLPLGYIVGICCDLLICTPLSRKIVEKATSETDAEKQKFFVLRFCMVILMTVAMTVFSVLVSGLSGKAAIRDFFTYLPYNFTIALPIQMLIIAPLSLRLAQTIAPVK